MTKQKLQEHDMTMAHETFRGRVTPVQVRRAEYIQLRLEDVLPSGFEAKTFDDANVYVEIENIGLVQVKPKGNETYDVLVWIGAKGELELCGRKIAIDTPTTLKYVGGLLTSYSTAGKAMQYNNSFDKQRSAEEDAQDADWQEPKNDLTHMQKKAGVERPTEENVYQYFKDQAEESDSPTDVIRNKNLYDLSSMVRTEKPGPILPSAGLDLLNHRSGHTEYTDKDKAEKSGNVIELTEGVQTLKVGGRLMVCDQAGRIQFIDKNVQVVQRKKKFGYDENAKAILKESLNKLQ